LYSAGAICPDGKVFLPSVNESKWEVNQSSGNDVYRLVECPPGYVISRDEKFPDQDRCILCAAGTYSLIAAVSTAVACRPCPVGGDCIGGDVVLAKEGFWRRDIDLEEKLPAAQIYKCPIGSLCTLNFSSGPFLTVPWLLTGNCLGQNECSNNGTGPVCGVCPDTSVMTPQGCKVCPSEDEVAPLRNMAIGVSSIVFLLFWVWFSWSPYFPVIGEYMNRIFCVCYEKGSQAHGLAEKVNNMVGLLQTVHEKAVAAKLPQYFKIFVSFFQVISSFLTFQVKWPITFLNAMMWLKATINFSVLSLPGVSCLWKTLSYRRKLLVYTLSPLILTAMLALPVGIALIRFKQSKQDTAENKLRAITRKKRLDASLDRFWNGVMFLAFMLYPMLSLITLEPFNCQPVGLGLLAADYREPCPEPASLESIWAAVFIMVYPVGIPVASILVLRSMGVHRLAKEKIDSALVSAMISLYIKRTSSVASQKIMQLIGPIGKDEMEFKRRVEALYAYICPDWVQARAVQQDNILHIGSRKVKVKVLEALNLPKTDRFGSIDAFCWISLGGLKERTNVCKNTTSPCWDKEEILFEIEDTTPIINDEMLALSIEVYDWDQLGVNTAVGTGFIDQKEVERIVSAAPGYSECFELVVKVNSGVEVDSVVSVGCQSCQKTVDYNKMAQNNKGWFTLYVQIESLGCAVAGTDVAVIRDFSIKYDTDGVSNKFMSLLVFFKVFSS
jgi:hypothetical protein